MELTKLQIIHGLTTLKLKLHSIIANSTILHTFTQFFNILP